MHRVLISAPAHPVLKERMEMAGYEVLDHPSIDRQQFESMIHDLHGLIISTRIPIHADLLERATKLQWIGRLGSGLEHIDLKAAAAKGIRVFSSPEGNCGAVGEHALGLLLNLQHKILKSALEVRDGKLIRDANSGVELNGKTIGIIGFGNTGRAFARVLGGFDVTILAHDKYLAGFGGQQVKEASKEQILRYSDVISLHLPLTEETHHYADQTFFEAMERKPFFINTSRGVVHDTQALIDALQNNRVAGAGLDVLEKEDLLAYTTEEKKQFDFLVHHPGVIITPHIAGYSIESFYKMSAVLADKLGL